MNQFASSLSQAASDGPYADAAVTAAASDMQAERRRQRAAELFYLVQQLDGIRERLPLLGLSKHDAAIDIVVMDIVKAWLKERPRVDADE